MYFSLLDEYFTLTFVIVTNIILKADAIFLFSYNRKIIHIHINFKLVPKHFIHSYTHVRRSIIKTHSRLFISF